MVGKHFSLLAVQVNLVECALVGLGEIGLHDIAALHHLSLTQETRLNDFVVLKLFFRAYKICCVLEVAYAKLVV